MRLSFARVETWQQALDLLRVRNECREGMTHATAEISINQQWSFYWDEIRADATSHQYEVYLLYDGKVAAGYGLLKRDGRRKWMTAGLARDYRGRGLSRVLIALITEIAYADPDTEVWIDVWDDNAALFGDIRAGYEFQMSESHDGRTLRYMRHRQERRLGAAEADWMTEHGRPALAHEPSQLAEMLEIDAISRAYNTRAD